MKNFFVYLVCNPLNTVIYTGVTSNLPKRINQHKMKTFPNAFTAKYNCTKLVWYQELGTHDKAFKREKQIKAGSRRKKIALIEEVNPEWKDLSSEWDEVL